MRMFSIVNTHYYDGSKLQEEWVKAQIDRMQKVKKYMNEDRFFDYEKKQAKYDPKTGKIELFDVRMAPEKKVIKNFDDLEKEKARLHKELNLTTEEVQKATEEELAERYAKLYELTAEGYKIDTSDFYAQTKDFLRVD
jgi:hypothetical protein